VGSIRIGHTNLSHRITSCGEVSHLASVIDLRENPRPFSKKSTAKQVQQQNKPYHRVISGVSEM